MQYRPAISQIIGWLKRPLVKQSIIVAILITTVVIFVRFFQIHPQYLTSLRHTNPLWILAVIGLNIPMIILLVFIYDACLKLCGHTLKWQENFFLTAYSSIANFFGPLQSGPGVRAVYLKTKHHVRLRDYGLATLLYYGLFATFSALFLFAGNRPWWQTGSVALAVIAVSGLVIYYFVQKDTAGVNSQFRLQRGPFMQLIIATFLQVLLTAITYFIELKAVNPHISWGQAVSYSGAANFALFVSLTPDAIGFRETFLVISKRLHHVSTANIISANIIDRGAYVIFLILLFILVLAFHARQRFQYNSVND
jgi:uncharacterized membrane protein YbhN (UPF0104 family)